MDENNNFNDVDDLGSNQTFNDEIITWTASEFVDSSKSSYWYFSFMLAILIIGGAIYLLTKSIFSAIAIVLMGGALCYMAARKPKEIDYSLDSSGININNVHYPFELFKSYSLVTDGGVSHITLTSTKRFVPTRSIYFEPDDGERIINHLGTYLPLENSPNDPIDKFMKRIRL
jgi:hypothetical protein